MLAMWGGETDQRLRPAMAKQGRPSAAIARIHAGRNIGKLMLSNWLSVYQSGALSTSSTTATIKSSTIATAVPVCAPRYVAPFRLSADPRPFCNGNIQTRRALRQGLHL